MSLPVTDLIAQSYSESDANTPSTFDNSCCQTLVSPSLEGLHDEEGIKSALYGCRPGKTDFDRGRPASTETLDKSTKQGSDLESGEQPVALDSLTYEAAHVPIGTSLQEERSRIPTAALSQTRKWILLAVFSCSQFLDIVSVSGALVALADIEASLGMEETTGTWVVNAYAIAFAGCLLLAGRVSDLYSPKIVFISGFVVLGVFAVACGVSTKPIMLLVFRGLQGAGGAFTIPSALNMIINIFPDKKSKHLRWPSSHPPAPSDPSSASSSPAYSSSSTGTSSSEIIGVIALPLSLACLFLIPKSEKKEGKLRQLDIVGVGLLTAGLVALIYALTTGSTDSNWTSPGVLTPMIASVILFLPAFFCWETRIPAKDALIPPATWRLPNFALMFSVAMVIYGWFQSMFVPMSTHWQVDYGLSSLQTSLRFLPCGITGGIITIHAAIYPQHYRPRYLLGPAMFLCALGSLLFCFASTKEKYFPFMLPGMIVGTVGGATAYVCCNIGMMQSGPKEFAGVLGAIFNSALQVGTSLIVSLITVLSSSIAKRSEPGSYAPYRAINYFMIGLMTVEGLAVMVLFKEGQERREVRMHRGGMSRDGQ